MSSTYMGSACICNGQWALLLSKALSMAVNGGLCGPPDALSCVLYNLALVVTLKHHCMQCYLLGLSIILV